MSPILTPHPPFSPHVPHPDPVSLPLVAGFTGAHCEIDIDECHPDPCHYGTCKDNIASFTCLCQPGYTGHRCDININECQSQPCKNGGTCQDRNNAYNCLCLKGTTGAQEGPPRGSMRVGCAAQHPSPIPVLRRVGPGPLPAAALVPGLARGHPQRGPVLPVWGTAPQLGAREPLAVEALCCGAAVGADELRFASSGGLGTP